MAASAASPTSPLRAKDLLSESSEAPGLNQVSSEVTSQLYTSLHLSRQAESTARAQLYLPAASPPPHEVLDGLAQELSHSLSVGLENNVKKKDGSKHIFEMESVRGQLQSMLQTSRDAAYRDPPIPGADSERREEDSFDSDSTATLLNTRPLQDLSPSSSAQAFEELFPRYTSLRPGPPLNPPDFQGLRDALDSEHTRRKLSLALLLQRLVALLQLVLLLGPAPPFFFEGHLQCLQLSTLTELPGPGLIPFFLQDLLKDTGLQVLNMALTMLGKRARYESQRIQMESELAVQLEQRVTERLAQAQESSLRQAASLRDHHRKQLQELNGQHQQELSTQLAQFKVEIAEREERQQQVAQDYELRLAREQARVRELQSGNQQLEEQRVELVERLQAMLQAHWEEATRLLSTTTLPPHPPVPPAGPSSPGLQEPDKGERRIWTVPTMAVALKPVLQQSRETREELPGVPPPVLCSPSPDLSLLLGPTFQSQHSFQPLEPKPDLTSSSVEAFSAVGTFHPDHRAERPFPEEDPGSEGDGFLKEGLPPPSQLQGLKHFLHQLLETAPQSHENPSVDQLPPKPGPLTAPSWEETPQVPRLPPPVHKTKVPLAMASSLFRVHELPSAPSQSGGPSGGSPERGGDGPASSRQLMEVSQLLRLYQARGWEALPAEDLLLYLKRLEHGGGGTDSRGENAPRRNTDSRLGEIPRKEVPSQALPRRLAVAPKTDKPPARKKSGHPAPGGVRSRGGIWR
ncbi:TPA: hypothetical protein BOS_18853 [Bos taurus]|nr:TPA: hypothetical protein BOS_18853 [Bos taurus]